MAQNGQARSMLVRLINIIKTSYSSKPQQQKKFIGEDFMGNKYYEYYNPNSIRQHQRHFERPTVIESKQVQDILDNPVPPAWDAWLRFRRTTAPTPEEVQEGINYFEMQQSRAAEIKAKDEIERRKEYPPEEPFKQSEHEEAKRIPKSQSSRNNKK